MQSTDLQVIKDIPGYKVILKAVLKSQIQQLVSASFQHSRSLVRLKSLYYHFRAQISQIDRWHTIISKLMTILGDIEVLYNVPINVFPPQWGWGGGGGTRQS